MTAPLTWQKSTYSNEGGTASNWPHTGARFSSGRATTPRSS